MTKEQQDWWNRQQQLLQPVREMGWDRFAATLDPKIAFGAKLGGGLCIDDGLQYLADDAKYGQEIYYRSPGLGCLYGHTLDEALQNAASIIIELPVDILYWHRLCGAAAKAVQKYHLNMTPDEFALYFATRLGALTHKPVDEMPLMRPDSFHPAVVVVYDGTGRFRRVKPWPMSFVVSRKLVGPQKALEDFDIATSLALGSHGYGVEFAKRDCKLKVVAIGDDQQQLNGLMEELDTKKPYLDIARVEIDGFVAPKA
jgi:hypothetical protein